MLSEVRGKQRHGNVKETRDGDVRERGKESLRLNMENLKNDRFITSLLFITFQSFSF